MHTDPRAIAWAAGLFEGEGCVRMMRIKASASATPSLSLQMTDEDVVRQMHAVTGLGRVYGPYQPKRADYKPIWAWHVVSYEKVQALIACWWPWLGTRRRAKARDVLLEARSRWLKPSARLTCPRGHTYDRFTRRRGQHGRVRGCSVCRKAAQKAQRSTPEFRARQRAYKRAHRRRKKELGAWPQPAII
jgi:hypothetical protein